MDKKYMIMVFSENLKTIRKANNLSMKKMAKKLGIGVKSLSLIESGVLPPKLSACILVTIYREFGFLPSEMFSLFKDK